jgi:hypothetical protein
MNRWLLTAALTAAVGASITGRTLAQQPAPAPSTIQPVGHEMYAPAAPPPIQPGCADGGNGANGRDQNGGLGQRIHEHYRKCLNSIGLGCAANHDTPGCSSCYAQYIFMFGSCRQFFGEPCFPVGPDTYPHPFYRNRGAGVAGDGGAGGGCPSCNR